MKLIVGLGNPGDKYAGNRHNVGFMIVDRLYAAFGFGPWRRRFSGEAADGEIGGNKCLLLKPLTYMNESGRSVAETMRFFRVELTDVLVVHDEIDLEAGRVRVKNGGGNAGHNGLKSLTNHIGNDYMRVRIGVGRPADKADVANYVLRDFAKSEQSWLSPLIDAVVEKMPVLFDKGSGAFSTEISKALELRNESGSEQSKSATSEASRKATRSDTKRSGSLLAKETESSNAFSEKLKQMLPGKKDGN